MATRQLLHKKESGHLGQYEDWWYLVVEESGDHFVLHEWDHVSVGNLSKNDGETRYAVHDFLDGNHNWHAKDALKKLLDAG